MHKYINNNKYILYFKKKFYKSIIYTFERKFEKLMWCLKKGSYSNMSPLLHGLHQCRKYMRYHNFTQS